MKVKVLKDFKDKNNNALCKEGVILDLSEDRVREINSTGYGTFLAIVSEEVQPVAEDKTENGDKPLNDMTVVELKELAEKLNIELDNKDKKDDIIAKINAHQQEGE